MILDCESCKSKFEIDEGLIKAEGSKVRCSQCQQIFTAYLPGSGPVEEAVEEEPVEEEAKEEEPVEEEAKEDSRNDTGAMESPPVLEDEDSDFFDEAELNGMDMTEEDGDSEPVSVEELTDDEIDGNILEEDEGEDAGDEEEIRLDVGSERASRSKRRKDSKTKPGWMRPFPILLVIIILLLGASGIVFFKFPNLIPGNLASLRSADQQDLTDIGVRRLAFQSVSGSFVHSNRAGQLFVIRGKVTNEYPKVRSYILIKGSLLDDKGIVVQKASAFAGNDLTEKQIKEMNIEEIKAGMKNRQGRENVNVNIKPNSTIPFMIILENLPENLSEFTVEAVSSQQGQ